VDVKIQKLDELLQARFQWSLVNTPIRFWALKGGEFPKTNSVFVSRLFWSVELVM